ncbi:MAG: methylenetetrahydrofolate reductase [Deltaproteobacteria bacterium]|nr:methylenetetrahydrofolate reductase [Deltaproteobacteria bacterium]
MKLKEALEKKKFVVTSEVQAPLDEEPGELIKSLELVRGRVDGVSVSDIEVEGIVGDTVKTCEILKKNRFEAIYQTTTRQKDRIQLQKDLVMAHEAGVNNLLVFTEDYRITGDSLQEMMFFHVDSGKLASVLKHMREGQTIDGKEIPFKAEFMLGSGVESAWGRNVPELEMKEMEVMTGIGTGYFLTGVPVIAEVMILRTAGMARFLNRHFKSGLVPEWIIQKLASATDRQGASIEIFADTVAGLKELCQGIHVITVGGDEKLRHYLNAARLA